jgi:DNA-binding NarL/FixJ family response regulator
MTENELPGRSADPPNAVIVSSDAPLRALLCAAAEAAGILIKIKMDARTFQLHPEWAAGAHFCLISFADLGLLLRDYHAQQTLRAFRLIPALAKSEFAVLNLSLKRANMLANLGGCLLPQLGPGAMTAALELAKAQYVALPAELLDTAIEERVLERRLSALSRDEQAVLTLLQAGKSNREISCALGLPQHKVKSLVKTLLDRLGCRKRTAAAVLAFRFGRAQSAELPNGPFGRE